MTSFRGWFSRQSDAGAWVIPEKLLLASYPQSADLERLAADGIRVVVNLHRRAHDPAVMKRLGMTEVHIPVPDFTPPTPGQIDQGVGAIATALAASRPVLVHCAGGRGRGGTLVACYLVSQGMPVDSAIAHVRELRPGAIETSRQEKAIEVWSLLPG